MHLLDCGMLWGILMIFYHQTTSRFFPEWKHLLSLWRDKQLNILPLALSISLYPSPSFLYCKTQNEPHILMMTIIKQQLDSLQSKTIFYISGEINNHTKSLSLLSLSFSLLFYRSHCALFFLSALSSFFSFPGMRIRNFFPRIRIRLSWKKIPDPDPTPDPTWNRNEEKNIFIF